MEPPVVGDVAHRSHTSNHVVDDVGGTVVREYAFDVVVDVAGVAVPAYNGVIGEPATTRRYEVPDTDHHRRICEYVQSNRRAKQTASWRLWYPPLRGGRGWPLGWAKWVV